MIDNDCKAVVRFELEQIGILYTIITLGVVETVHDLTQAQEKQLVDALLRCGYELIKDTKLVLVEKIKITLIELIQTSKKITIRISTYLTQRLRYNYTYLSKLFSKNVGMTIEHFFIIRRVERAKALILQGGFTVSEIAFSLNYSNVSHLSNQFKQITGLRPSQFKRATM